jgi:hypothetical protein
MRTPQTSLLQRHESLTGRRDMPVRRKTHVSPQFSCFRIFRGETYKFFWLAYHFFLPGFDVFPGVFFEAVLACFPAGFFAAGASCDMTQKLSEAKKCRLRTTTP